MGDGNKCGAYGSGRHFVAIIGGIVALFLIGCGINERFSEVKLTSYHWKTHGGIIVEAKDYYYKYTNSKGNSYCSMGNGAGAISISCEFYDGLEIK